MIIIIIICFIQLHYQNAILLIGAIAVTRCTLHLIPSEIAVPI